MDNQNASTSAQKSLSIKELEEASDACITAMHIEGMDCINCAARVRDALTALDGVVSAAVDWQQGLAIVDYIPTKTNIASLVGAVARASNGGQRSYSAHRIG